jgi:hypothetical protein
MLPVWLVLYFIKEKKRASSSWIHKHEKFRNYAEGNGGGKLNSQINKVSFESVWQTTKGYKRKHGFHGEVNERKREKEWKGKQMEESPETNCKRRIYSI